MSKVMVSGQNSRSREVFLVWSAFGFYRATPC